MTLVGQKGALKVELPSLPMLTTTLSKERRSALSTDAATPLACCETPSYII